MDTMASESTATEQHAKSQTLLVEFLQADLDLAFTILRTAEIERGSDTRHCLAATEKVRAAISTVRRLQGRVEDSRTWTLIQNRADELQYALEKFLG